MEFAVLLSSLCLLTGILMRERERDREIYLEGTYIHKHGVVLTARERDFEVSYIAVAHRQAWCCADC